MTMFMNWFRSATAQKGRVSRINRMRTAHRRPCFEPLEARWVLSTFVVGTTADLFNPNDKPLSLRDAISAANAAPGSTVVIPAGAYNLTRLGAGEGANATGDLDITANMTIKSKSGKNDVTIDGQSLVSSNSDRIFDLHNQITVSMSGLTIANGMPTDTQGTIGGGILVENQGAKLTLTNCTVKNCRIKVTNPNLEGDGGGIFSAGSLTLVNCTVSNNTIAAQNGEGGGIYGNADVTLTNSTVTGNSAPSANNAGGGVYAETVTISQCTVTQNTTGGAGGGIFGTTVVVSKSHVDDNQANAVGGGIYAAFQSLVTANSTVNGNTAASYGGQLRRRHRRDSGQGDRRRQLGERQRCFG
jgi:hypothetical protein